MSDLNTALAKAIGDAHAVEKDGFNQHHRYRYATAENVLAVARTALAKNGLSLVPVDASVADDHLTRTYKLCHSSGGHETIKAPPWPIVQRKGGADDKALAAAMTCSLRWTLRDLLLLPQVEESEEMDARDDRRGPQPQPERDKLARDLRDRILLLAEKAPRDVARQVGELLGKAKDDIPKLRRLETWTHDKLAQPVKVDPPATTPEAPQALPRPMQAGGAGKSGK